MTDTDTLSVQQTAEKTGLSGYTLRYYEKIGLINPVRRSAGGQRLYSKNDLEWIGFLQRLRSTGMSVGLMVEYARCCGEGDETFDRRLAIMKEHRARILGKMDELKSFLSAIEWKINYYTEQKEKR
ncbi:MAG: MerR family transcriptional regulator [Spirochaetales bacterium]|nr:MerR family transcriptional regulator [Spirochaetales bacterium]